MLQALQLLAVCVTLGAQLEILRHTNYNSSLFALKHHKGQFCQLKALGEVSLLVARLRSIL